MPGLLARQLNWEKVDDQRLVIFQLVKFKIELERQSIVIRRLFLKLNMNNQRLCTPILFILSFVGSASFAQDNLQLPKIFTDNMVLQQEMPIVVWGWAKEGTIVEVVFAGHSEKTTTDKTGKWMVILPAMKADGKQYHLAIRTHVADNETPELISLSNIVLGEVWLCAGQSNMNRGVDVRKENRDKYPACSGSMARPLQNRMTWAIKSLGGCPALLKVWHQPNLRSFVSANNQEPSLPKSAMSLAVRSRTNWMCPWA